MISCLCPHCHCAVWQIVNLMWLSSQVQVAIFQSRIVLDILKWSCAAIYEAAVALLVFLSPALASFTQRN
jgi:hypothetical protein